VKREIWNLELEFLNCIFEAILKKNTKKNYDQKI